MKVFDSGMPDESYWNSLFDIAAIVEWLQLDRVTDPIAEIGCGYGTFTVPVAGRSAHKVYAIDIEPEMIRIASDNVGRAGLGNVSFQCRDVADGGTGLASGSIGMALLFNILHSPERGRLLEEASRIVKKHGRIAIIHWRKDIPTPRGPRVDSRPDARMVIESLEGLDLRAHGDSTLLGPYHWGMQLIKAGT